VRGLTDRQLEILVHEARGRTNPQIGRLLGISERTVRNHMRSILRRLTSTDRTQAVVIAIEHGWIAIPIEPEVPERTAAKPVSPDSGEEV
jgi:DNA-binding NarL/FixJ family response regulator